MKFSNLLAFVPFAFAAPSVTELDTRCASCDSVVGGISGGIDGLAISIEVNLLDIQQILSSLAGIGDGGDLDPDEIEDIVEGLSGNILPIIEELNDATRDIIENVILGVDDLEFVIQELAAGQILSLANALGRARQIAQALRDILERLDDLPSAIQDLINDEIDALEKALELFLAPIVAFVDIVCETLEGVGGDSVGALGGALDGVIDVVSGLLEGLGLDGLLGGGLEGELPNLSGGVPGLLGGAKQILEDLLDE